jgi:excisionase family DNA binding protein
VIDEPIGEKTVLDTSWVAIHDVAKHFSVSRDTVERWIQAGYLRAVNLGLNKPRAGRNRACWRISAESLEEFVRSRMSKTLPVHGQRRSRRRLPADVIEFIK